MKYLSLLLVVLIHSQLLSAQTEIKPLHSFSLNDCVAFAQKNNVQVKNSLLAIDVQVQPIEKLQQPLILQLEKI